MVISDAYTVEEMVWHVVTHEQYHRGQIFTRLGLLGPGTFQTSMRFAPTDSSPEIIGVHYGKSRRTIQRRRAVI